MAHRVIYHDEDAVNVVVRQLPIRWSGRYCSILAGPAINASADDRLEPMMTSYFFNSECAISPAEKSAFVLQRPLRLDLLTIHVSLLSGSRNIYRLVLGVLKHVRFVPSIQLLLLRFG